MILDHPPMLTGGNCTSWSEDLRIVLYTWNQYEIIYQLHFNLKKNKSNLNKLANNRVRWSILEDLRNKSLISVLEEKNIQISLKN